MRIALIAAMTSLRVIGDGNRMPWHLPEELQHFKATTLGKPVIMGRKTFESLGNKPLPGRLNIVLTRDTQFRVPEGVRLVHTVKEAMDVVQDREEVMVIGGAEIYQRFLPLADRLYLSIIHESYQGSVYFPEYDVEEWKIFKEEVREKFTLQIFDRKKKQEV